MHRGGGTVERAKQGGQVLRVQLDDLLFGLPVEVRVVKQGGELVNARSQTLLRPKLPQPKRTDSLYPTRLRCEGKPQAAEHHL